MKHFKETLTFDERCIESQKIRTRHRHSGPIIVEPHDDKTPAIDRCKYLVPWDLTYGQFLFVVRKRIKLSPEQALFITVNGTLVSSSKTIGEIYCDQCDEDGFLYVNYTNENTFG